MTEAEYLSVQARTHVRLIQLMFQDILEECVPWIDNNECTLVKSMLASWLERSATEDPPLEPSQAQGNDKE